MLGRTLYLPLYVIAWLILVLIRHQRLLHTPSHHYLLLGHLRLDRQLALASERAIQPIPTCQILVHGLTCLLIVGWTIKKGLSINCPPLLELLFELIWNYLLGDHRFSARVMDWTIIFRVFDLGLGI